MPVDVATIGADFVALSGHKMMGPSGIGALWARHELLDAMPPFLAGGSMISRVTLERTTFAETPWKFEAGTPAIAEAMGLAAAIDYLDELGMRNVRQHERWLTDRAWDALGTIDGLRRFGPGGPDEQAGIISFTLQGIHPHDIATVLDAEGVAVRAGHHCAQPVMLHYEVPATTRASFYVYNDLDDIEALVDAIGATIRLFRG
jgi:cysteine desulfurase/selenocysteine lyase